MHFCRVGPAQWRRLTEQGRQGALLLGQQCLLSITDCSTIVGARTSVPAEPRKRPSAQQVFVGSKPGKTTTESQNAAKSWANVVRGDPMKDMTAVPPPAVPPATVESQVSRRVSMDTTGVGVTPTQDQDRSRVATLPSPASGSKQISADGHVKCWCRPPSPKFRTEHRFLCRSSLSRQGHDPPSWQTLPHSFRCSCHQCSRS